jgi:hypothetical protein
MHTASVDVTVFDNLVDFFSMRFSTLFLCPLYLPIGFSPALTHRQQSVRTKVKAQAARSREVLSTESESLGWTSQVTNSEASKHH